MDLLKKFFGNRSMRLFLILLFFVLIVILRRTDVVAYPQFYAEDGVFGFLRRTMQKTQLIPF
jgi:hypothetical protein